MRGNYPSFWRYNDGYSQGKIDWLRIASIILCVLGIICFWGGFDKNVESETFYTCYDIYYVNAPFGIVWVETTGSGSFLFMAGSLHLGSEVSETYIVKYLDNGELHTKTFDSTKIPIVPDGTFQLEYSERWETHERNLFGTNLRGPYDKTYRIHIPQLPALNETISMEWSYVK